LRAQRATGAGFHCHDEDRPFVFLRFANRSGEAGRNRNPATDGLNGPAGPFRALHARRQTWRLVRLASSRNDITRVRGPLRLPQAAATQNPIYNALVDPL
jgi:hypothetical protein